MSDLLGETWQRDWGRLLGSLVAGSGRPDLAEDVLAEAFADAAAQWPEGGVPDNPAAWLRVAARRRLSDALRRESTARAKAPLLTPREPVVGPPPPESFPGEDSDDRLALLFMATHPSLAPEVRPALALRFVLGVPTETIARLMLVPTPTLAARLTRAKRRLVTTGVAFRVPPQAEWPDRVDDVARAVYLAFTAGYLAAGSENEQRVQDASDAVRLAVLAAELLPGQPVLEALVALLLLQHARRDARFAPDGSLVLLADQDRTRWRRDEIDRGLELLAGLSPDVGLAEELRLQAVIAAQHDLAPTAADTDWAAICAAYARLESVTGSPVVRLNRAVAVAEVEGPAAGLELLDGLDEALPGHHRVHLVRAELLRRTGRPQAARSSYRRALELCPEGPERTHIAGRLDSTGLN